MNLEKPTQPPSDLAALAELRSVYVQRICF
jgi:hypothetical protein